VVLDARAAAAPTPAARDELAVRAARLTETDLSDVEGAIGRYQKILAMTPTNPGALEALWNIARGTDYRLQAIGALEPVMRNARNWESVVELTELRLAVEDSVEARLAGLAEIARIEEVERKDTHKAFEAWARALTEEATASAPREALERLAAATGDWAGLARVYAERMDATFDASLQRSLALRLAELHEGKLNDLSKAADYLRQALSLPGDEAAVLASLEALLRKQDAHSELAEILAREAEVAVDPAVQAEFLAALGETRLRALDDADGALTAFRDALERNPAHAASQAALHELLDREATREGALEVLEPLAEARGDHEELLALYEYRVGLRDDAGERAHWLRKIAEICDGVVGDAGRALDALGRALEEEPMPGAALDDLERIAGAAKMSAAGAAKIEAVLDAAEPDAGRELALRAARLYEAATDGRADLAGAERLYSRVLAADPENVDALGALEGLYRGVGAAGAAHLASILERRAAVELDPAARKKRLAEAAKLHEQHGDVEGAIAAWQSLRAAEEGDALALGELARLYESTGQTDEDHLVGALTERARFAEDPSERAALWARAGELRLAAGNVDGAAEAYKEALEGAPDNLTVLGALEAIEEKRQDWTALQEILVRRLGGAQGAAQIPVLLKLAKNAETRLDDVDQAAGYLRQILDVQADNGAAYLELERLLRKGERWYDLVDVLGKHADVEAAAKRKPSELALRVAIADVWEQELSSPESAVEALEKVLEVAPTNVAALLSMARIHEGAERWDEAAAALERAAATASSGEEAAEIAFRNAQILKAKEAPAEEIEALLLRALDSNPAHVKAIEALEAIARAAKDDERLVQLLDLRLEATAATAKPDEQRKLLSEIAALYKKLGRGGQAVPVLERLVAIAPDEIGGREDLADALIAAGRTDEAVKIARDLIEQLGKARRGKEAARWYQRLGAIAIAGRDLAGASEHFNAAYKLDPAHPLTLSALGRLAYEKGDLETARKFYRSLLLQNFDEASTGVSKAEVYLMLGRMHVAAKEIPKARNMFERGLETDPKNELLKQALAQLPS
jgi:tetratricopeptide (TPR) repeat protein